MIGGLTGAFSVGTKVDVLGYHDPFGAVGVLVGPGDGRGVGSFVGTGVGGGVGTFVGDELGYCVSVGDGVGFVLG